MIKRSDDVGYNADNGDISHLAVYVAKDIVLRTHDLMER